MSYSFDKDFEYDDRDGGKDHRCTNPFSDDLFFAQRRAEEITAGHNRSRESDREYSDNVYGSLIPDFFIGFYASIITTFAATEMLYRYSETFAKYIKSNPDIGLTIFGLGGLLGGMAGSFIGIEIRDKLLELRERRSSKKSTDYGGDFK